MTSILQHTYGEPERVLVTRPAPLPTPGPDAVLVRMHATSVNTPDWIATLGVPYVLRLGAGLRGPRIPERGSDLSGVVVSVGARVTGFSPGDEVFGSVWTGTLAGSPHGTFCEYTVVPARQLAPIPAGLDFPAAAGAVMSGVTALQALRDVAQVRAGQRVLINGASGGVGTFAVQIARALGAEVTGVCSARNVELVRSLGARHVVDYTETRFVDHDARYDVIMDNVMNDAPAVTARALAPDGVLLLNSIGSGKWFGALPRMVGASLFHAKTWRTTQFNPSRANLDALAALLASGAVRVVVDTLYPLQDAGKAVAHMATRRARGKVVLLCAEPTTA